MARALQSALARAEMALKELELTCTRYEPEATQALRDDIDLKKWAVNQSAGQYIRSHEAVQRISIRRQLHAFMQVSGDALAAALAPELMHLREQPDIVRERALDRAAASVREALSVNAPKIPVFLIKIAMHAYAAWLCMQNPEFSTPRRTSTGAA
ncbi:phage polarity suppression protein [Citrobacter freundii]|uniref:phage polarity suppression protein n=1 Tax=Citrobacter freundii TaxID=546 RepID=UPI0023EDF2B5|nr:phage polarity suppression protein [Citrobacter freundii]